MAEFSGSRFGVYEIVSLIGAGGMGEVYRGRDTRLGREVALKILRDAGASDPTWHTRFEREARVLASLNHPNIATIYGLEEKAPGQPGDVAITAIAMELVDGETLADRLRRGPLPLDEALDVARQIADALAAAHDKGIVHRDLKPANVKIASTGAVKVLDFGLAKVAAADAAQTDPADSETASPATRLGLVLGTPAYMSPEQARGSAVDCRADIFALGGLMYEMLVGRRAFDGGSVADTLAHVLQRDPDWTLVPPGVPPAVHRLMRLCLEKDPKKRRQSAGDVRIDLDQARADPPPASATIQNRGSRTALVMWTASGLIVMAVLAIPAVTHFREQPPPEMHVQIVTPPTRFPLSFALSPDARYIVFVASGSSANDPDRLYLRRLDKNEAQPIAGTDHSRLPFWSPDSRSVGYFASGKLYRVDIAGGRAQALASASNPQGGAWNADGTILFAPDTVSPLFRVPASGGEAVTATTLDAPRQTNHRRPSFLPDGRRFLFQAAGDPDVSGLYLGSLDGQAPARLVAGDLGGEFLAPDRIVFLQQDALVARLLDRTRSILTGDPVTLAPSVRQFSVSATGVIAHRAAGRTRIEATWIDRNGLVTQDGAIPFLNGPELSSDGRRLVGDRTVDGNRDIWIADLARGGLTRFTTHPAVDGFPLWSPDDQRVAFHSSRNGTIDLWIKPSSGGEEQRLLDAPDSEWPIHWSKDGRFLLYQRSDLKAAWNLWALPMTGTDRTPIAVAQTPFAERLGEFSPDGRWVAYETDESGRPEIVAQAFPHPLGRWPVSTSGGAAPRWNADGTAIYFIAPDGQMMAAPVTTKGSAFEPGPPVRLFPTQLMPQIFKYQYAVSRDGRFLLNTVAPETAAPPINLILNVR
jgi:serine/threonine protein kinase